MREKRASSNDRDVSRRRFLKLLGVGAGGAALSLLGASHMRQYLDAGFTGYAGSGSPCNPESYSTSSRNPASGGPTVQGKWWVTGEPTGGHAAALGGGPHYQNKIKPNDSQVIAQVSSPSELLQALRKAGSGDIVWVKSDATIPIGADIAIPEGVILASGRGINGSRGGMIEHTNSGTDLFLKDNCRVTGLRLKGSRHGVEPGKTGNRSQCVNAEEHSASGVEIDNCEIFGGGRAGIEAGPGTQVHHCDIHHIEEYGVGYGIVGNDWEAWYCTFNYCRHAVDGSGKYVVRDSWFGPKFLDHVTSHHNADNADVTLQRCTFEYTTSYGDYNGGGDGPTTRFRNGTPESFVIENCWYFDKDPGSGPVSVADSAIYSNKASCSGWDGCNFTLNNNVFGTKQDPGTDIGHPR